MKKKFQILMYIFAVFCVKLDAQSFSLQTISNANINNGDTVVINGTTNDLILTAELLVVNNSSVMKTVLVRKTELFLVAGCQNAFTWGWINYPPSVNLSPFGEDINPGDTNSNFVTDYLFNGVAGTSYVMYSFFDQSNPADSSWMVFQFNISLPAGTFHNTYDQPIYPFPNPTKGIFNIALPVNFTSATNADIYSSGGRIIASIPCARGIINLRFDLTELPEGSYYIRLMNNQQLLFNCMPLFKN